MKTSYKYLCPATKGNELVLNLKGSKEEMIYCVTNEQDNFDCLTSGVSKCTCFWRARAKNLGNLPKRLFGLMLVTCMLPELNVVLRPGVFQTSQVSRFCCESSIARSHDETGKSHDKQRDKLKRCNFLYNFIFGLLRWVLSQTKAPFCSVFIHLFVSTHWKHGPWPYIEDMFQITSPSLPVSHILITFSKWRKLLMNLMNIYQTKSVVNNKQDTDTSS